MERGKFQLLSERIEIIAKPEADRLLNFRLKEGTSFLHLHSNLTCRMILAIEPSFVSFWTHICASRIPDGRPPELRIIRRSFFDYPCVLVADPSCELSTYQPPAGKVQARLPASLILRPNRGAMIDPASAVCRRQQVALNIPPPGTKNIPGECTDPNVDEQFPTTPSSDQCGSLEAAQNVMSILPQTSELLNIEFNYAAPLPPFDTRTPAVKAEFRITVFLDWPTETQFDRP
ncbi:hypothetical protein DFH06DRAFT_1447699 [Mycena polygramma]|nr:hypothetical protein DFH06DRAFT_1447699 [Mycena polygramma]